MDKKPWRSKTLWVNALTAVAALIPGVGDWVRENPTIFMTVFAVVNMILRLVTQGRVALDP